MKHAAAKKKKVKETEDLKVALCDIVKKIEDFEKTDKKLEELVDYCLKTEQNYGLKANCK